MANLKRTAKPASDWSSYELDAFNIEVQTVDAATFFMDTNPNELPAVAPSLSDTILNIDLPVGSKFPDVQAKSDRLFFQYLREADLFEDSAVRDFTTFLLSLLDFDGDDKRFVRTQQEMHFYMGQEFVDARPDVALLNKKPAVNFCILIARAINKNEFLSVSSTCAEARLIAESIAAFEPARHPARYPQPLERQVIPGILMFGSMPVFYRTPVSADLLNALDSSWFPEEKTVVMKYLPPMPNQMTRGMGPLENRLAIFQSLEAFKGVVDRMEEEAYALSQQKRVK